MLCPLTNNAQMRGNYNSVIKSVELDPNNEMKFIMHAQNINWTNNIRKLNYCNNCNN